MRGTTQKYRETDMLTYTSNDTELQHSGVTIAEFYTKGLAEIAVRKMNGYDKLIDSLPTLWEAIPNGETKDKMRALLSSVLS